MNRTKIILIITLLIFCNYSFAMTEILCKARYFYQRYNEPVYYEGSTIGKIPIRKGYYENVWSNTYTLNVKFFSGFELNEYYNQQSFNNNSIVALVSWNNGGHSLIIIKDWTTNLKYMTEKEVKYTSEGEKINLITGYDLENRFWEFYF